MVVRYAEAVSLVGLEEAMGRLAAHPSFRVNSPTLWDLTEASSEGLRREEMRTLASRLARFRQGSDRPRVAVLTALEEDFGEASMFAGVTRPVLLTELSVFRDREDALTWLGAEAESSDP